MKRTLKLADIIAALGGVILLVSSFLGALSGSSYSSWHSLFINQLVVTDLLGLAAAVVIVLSSLRLLPTRLPWTTWAAAAAVAVLLNSIFAPVQVHEFLSQSGVSAKVGIGFYLAIVGAIILAAGACLAWIPALQRVVIGRAKAPAGDVGYQGAPGQPQPYQPHQPQPSYPGAQGQSQSPQAAGGFYGGPTPPLQAQGPFQPQSDGDWPRPAPDPSRPGPALGGPVGATALAGPGDRAPAAPVGPRLDPSGAWTAPWAPNPAEPPTAVMSRPTPPTQTSDGPADSPSTSMARPADPSAEPAATPPTAYEPPTSAPTTTGPPFAADATKAEPTAGEPTGADPTAAESAPANPTFPQPGPPQPAAAEPTRESEPFKPEPAPASTPLTPWGESQPPPAPPAPFAPFWAAVPVPRTVYSADQAGLPVGGLQPGIWYAVVANHASGGYIVQLPTGGHGVLVETADLIRG